MKTVRGAVLGAVTAGWVFAAGPWVVTSVDTAVDTRLWTSWLAEDGGEADSRSFSEGWSGEGRLDTRIHRGTILLII